MLFSTSVPFIYGHTDRTSRNKHILKDNISKLKAREIKREIVTEFTRVKTYKAFFCRTQHA